MITCHSGEDMHYMSGRDMKQPGLPILMTASKKFAVANRDTYAAKYVTQLPIPNMLQQAAEADTFDEFLHSLMRVGLTVNAGTMSIFTKEYVYVYNDSDMLII